LSQTQFLERAVALALANVHQHSGGPFGALIVRAGEIIGEGVNQVTTSCDPTAHAEVMAIRAATQKLGNFNLTGCEIYTSCEPCPMCLGAIYWARLDRIYFAASRQDAAAAGFDDQFLYEEIAKDLPHRRLPIERLALPSARDPFTAWEQDAAKIRY
jgi:tRNA(Arg) A34 adenosine deaminase TadA